MGPMQLHRSYPMKLALGGKPEPPLLSRRGPWGRPSVTTGPLLSLENVLLSFLPHLSFLLSPVNLLLQHPPPPAHYRCCSSHCPQLRGLCRESGRGRQHSPLPQAWTMAKEKRIPPSRMEYFASAHEGYSFFSIAFSK